MKIQVLFSLLSALWICLPIRGEVAPLTNIVEVLNAIARRDYGHRFELTADISSPLGENNCGALGIVDGTGALSVFTVNDTDAEPTAEAGDRILIRGYVDCSQFIPACARLSSLTRLGHSPAPAPQAATPDGITRGDFDHRLVSVTGNVRDIFADDIDASWGAMIIESDAGQVNVCFTTVNCTVTNLEQLVNARVSVEGLCLTHTVSYRKMFGRHIHAGRLHSLKVLKASQDPLFCAPNLEDLRGIQASEIARIGRRRVFGKVIAVRGDQCFFVNYPCGGIVRVETAESNLPEYGDIIDATGFPETDLYRVNLTRAA